MLRALASQVLLAATVFGAGYYYGSRGDREVKVINEVVEKVVIETIYEDRIKYVDRVKTVEKLVPQVIEREVYKNICMDDDGVKSSILILESRNEKSFRYGCTADVRLYTSSSPL